MVDNCEIITKSAQETQEFGAKIAGALTRSLPAGRQGTVICLYGDLGSGKTTFMQGFAQGLGIKQRILSPTFVLMREYAIRDTQHVTRETGNGKRKTDSVSRITYHVSRLIHIDLYRINEQQETESLGLQDLWSDPKNIVAIEWPEKIKNILPKERIEIYFEYLNDDKRKISLSFRA